jgi:hypothetical protein
MEFVCRSNQQVNEDELVEAHTRLTHALNERCNGVLLYRGRGGKACAQMLAQVEAAILRGECIEGIGFRCSWLLARALDPNF